MCRLICFLIKFYIRQIITSSKYLLCQMSLFHSFLPDLYLLFSLPQCFLVCSWKTPRYLCCVSLHFKGNNKYIEFTRRQELEDTCVAIPSAHNHWIIPIVRHGSKPGPGHMVLQHWVMGMKRGKSYCPVPRENKWAGRRQNMKDATCGRRDGQTMANSNDLNTVTAVEVKSSLYRAQDKGAIPAFLNCHRPARKK